VLPPGASARVDAARSLRIRVGSATTPDTADQAAQEGDRR
jgi:hypothetical protein